MNKHVTKHTKHQWKPIKNAHKHQREQTEADDDTTQKKVVEAEHD